MIAWRSFDLETIEAADELEIASVGVDGGWVNRPRSGSSA